jgi:hypothetical protein
MTEVLRDKPLFAIRLPMQFSCAQSGGDAKTRFLWFRVFEAQRQTVALPSVNNNVAVTGLRAMADAALGVSSHVSSAEKVYHFEVSILSSSLQCF